MTIETIRKAPEPGTGNRPLYEVYREIELPELAEFDTKRHFSCRTICGSAGEVGLSVSDEFKELFLEGKGKFEEAALATTLKFSRLIWEANEWEMIGELGGREKVEIKLSQIWELMRTDSWSGHYDNIPWDSFVTIFHAADLNGNLQLITVDRGTGGSSFCVGCVPYSGPNKWGPFNRVVSK